VTCVVDADYLKRVIAPFADPEVGAVTAFYKKSQRWKFRVRTWML